MHDDEKNRTSSKVITKRELSEADSQHNLSARSQKKTRSNARKNISGDSGRLRTAINRVPAVELLPFPYYNYRNHSTDVDDDPNTPVTLAGHVPGFPIKMFAILASPELNHILKWDDHGRSFKILDLKSFETYILPKLFGHTRITAFIQQACAHGFRRLDSGSYYHELFLRSLPWLCKRLRRLTIGERAFPNICIYEPRLGHISQEFPIPNLPMTREIQVVLDVMNEGHDTPMPAAWGSEQMPIVLNAEQENVGNEDGNESKNEEESSPAGTSSTFDTPNTEAGADKLSSPIQKPEINEAAGGKNIAVSGLLERLDHGHLKPKATMNVKFTTGLGAATGSVCTNMSASAI